MPPQSAEWLTQAARREIQGRFRQWRDQPASSEVLRRMANGGEGFRDPVEVAHEAFEQLERSG